jgi:uncharacterized SAM-binding protein YcdF (DUF218 family)
MTPMLRRLLELCLLPPLSCLLLLLLGTILRRKHPRVGVLLQLAAALLLWLFATPAFAGFLLGTLQPFAALGDNGSFPQAEAIVVLSAEADLQAPEYGHAVIGSMTLQRVRYAAFLRRQTGLPILCSGGRPARDCPALAKLMADALQQEFGVETRWSEEQSADTWENAAMSAALLRRDGVQRILLVTNAWHEPRAVASFRAQGLEVVPAPTGFRGPAIDNLLSFAPQHAALRDSSLALHEWFGRFCYLFK